MAMSQSKLSNQIISHDYVDLKKYPQTDEKHQADVNNQLTIGDLHGNALKLIYFLIRQNVLIMDEKNYQELVDIYQIDTDSLVKENLDKFNNILSKSKTKAVGTVRLIGDELADRGSNDYFTLKVFEKLVKEGVAVEILFSNHGAEFIQAYEKQDNFIPPYLGVHASSMLALNVLVKKGILNRIDILSLVNQYYKPCLKALSYTLNEDRSKITLYSHAPIGLSAIKSIARKLKLYYSDASATDLARTIDNINNSFSIHVMFNNVTQLYANENGSSSVLDIDHKQCPLVYLIWNRSYNQLDRPEKHINGYTIDFVHGHDANEDSHKNIYNLDNALGQADFFSGPYEILFSQDTPSLRRKSLKAKIENKQASNNATHPETKSTPEDAKSLSNHCIFKNSSTSERSQQHSDTDAIASRPNLTG